MHISKPRGGKVWLGEVDGGIISDYQVLDGAPPDAAQVAGSVARHRRQFGHRFFDWGHRSDRPAARRPTHHGSGTALAGTSGATCR